MAARPERDHHQRGTVTKIEIHGRIRRVRQDCKAMFQSGTSKRWHVEEDLPRKLSANLLWLGPQPQPNTPTK